MGIIRRMQITQIQDKKTSIFLKINYNVVYWKIYIISAIIFMWIIIYKNKGLKPVFFFFEKSKQGYRFVGNGQFSVGFKVCSLGVQKVIFGGFGKN